MKARIKATGEVINVEINKSAGGNQLYVGRSNWDGVEYTFLGDELEPINESIKCDWQQVRIQFISAALTGLLANPDSILNRESIVEAALKIADALIAELQKKGGE